MYTLVDLLPKKLQPYAKAVAAALTPLLAALVLGLVTGGFNTEEIALAATSLVSVIVLGVPNKPA